MDDALLPEFGLPQDVLQPLLVASNSSNLGETLKSLIEVARTDVGRADLSSKNIIPSVLQLIRSLPNPSGRELLPLSLKLVRNLCAGEIANQNKFIEQSGVGNILTVLRSARCSSDPDCELICMGVQVLANVSLAGEHRQHAIWHQVFPDDLLAIARVQSQNTCDPLCMIIYTCCDGSSDVAAELCGDGGLAIVGRNCKDYLCSWLWRKLVEASPFSSLLSRISISAIVLYIVCYRGS